MLGLISGHFDTNNPMNILGNRDEWPIGSANLFVRDHKNQGEGLKGLVFNSVIDLKVMSDFSALSVEDMFFHLHIASIYYGLPTTKSVDLATMTLHISPNTMNSSNLRRKHCLKFIKNP